MKAKYFILSAVVAIASLLIGCTPEKITGNDISGLSVEASYLQIPPAGGSATLKFTISDEWKIFEEASYTWKNAENKSVKVDTLIAPTGVEIKPHGVKLKSWLTADKTSGGEGEHTVTITAPKSDNYKSVVLHLVCGDKTQYITVSQNEPVISQATCAEVIAGPDGKVFMVKGICTSIENTTYGNWYLNDGTGEIYIYGTVDATGAYNWASFNIAVGDEVTVQGPKTTYGTVIELVDVSVLKVKKALLALEQDVFNVGSAASTITINATVKGQSFNYENEVPWLSIASVKDVDGVTAITVNVAENAAPTARTGVLEFSSSTGKDVTNLSVTVVQAGLKGQTPENPYTVADAISTINSGAAGTEPVYVKGKISKVDEVSATYGNAGYWISDDGTTNGHLQVHRGKKFGVASFVEGDVLGLGWEVVIYGVLSEYNGNPQIGKNSQIYSIEGATAEMTIAEAIAYIDSEGYDATKKIIVGGKVNTADISLDYGNASVWISEDGATKAFQLHRNFYFKGAKYTSTDQLNAGDAIKAVGIPKKYNTSYQLDKNNYILVLNGLTAPSEVN